jgi:integrase
MASGRTSNTALHVFTVLRAALNAAEKSGLVRRNVCRAAHAPKLERYSVTVPNSKEIDKVLAVTDSSLLGVFFRLAYLTGLRRGELLGLRWSAVSFESDSEGFGRSDLLSVIETVQAVRGQGLVVQQPKSAHGRRASCARS